MYHTHAYKHFNTENISYQHEPQKINDTSQLVNCIGSCQPKSNNRTPAHKHIHTPIYIYIADIIGHSQLDHCSSNSCCLLSPHICASIFFSSEPSSTTTTTTQHCCRSLTLRSYQTWSWRSVLHFDVLIGLLLTLSVPFYCTWARHKYGYICIG